MWVKIVITMTCIAGFVIFGLLTYALCYVAGHEYYREEREDK